jgi:hypothetical protein
MMATNDAFQRGGFRRDNLAVMHSNGYIKSENPVKDRLRRRDHFHLQSGGSPPFPAAD